VQEGSQAEVASLVASGAGVAIVPASLRAIRRAGVLYRPLHERPMTRLDLDWRKDAASPVLDAFLAEVQQSARSIQPKARSAVPAQ
jgi:DNA-binding transcriptional LysR family regulator